MNAAVKFNEAGKSGKKLRILGCGEPEHRRSTVEGVVAARRDVIGRARSSVTKKPPFLVPLDPNVPPDPFSKQGNSSVGTLFLVIPLLLILVTLAYGVAQVLVRAWLDYRVRIAFLEKLEKNPALVGSQADVPAIMSSIAATSFAYQRQNYVLTGLLLTGFGIVFLAVGRFMRSGELAVGIFFGGVFCVLLGLVIALFGFIVRVMTRHSSKANAPTRG